MQNAHRRIAIIVSLALGLLSVPYLALSFSPSQSLLALALNQYGAIGTPTNAFTGSVSVADQVAFAPSGSMNVARSNHTATLLNNGKVLVAGGYGNGPNPASAELYDPASGTWSSTGSMSVARSNHTATLLLNGKVLVTGGSGSGGTSAELYDPASGTWSSTGSMSVARSNNHTATLLPNGKVLVVGFTGAELYDPVSGTWNITGSMIVGCGSHTATLLPNGKVLVVGGGIKLVSIAELYDPTSGIWSTAGSMIVNKARYAHTSTLLNGKVLVAGGDSSAELYDLVTDTWSMTGGMSVIRDSHTATLLPSGKVLIAGGRIGSSQTRASAELYDPASGTWSSTGSMSVTRSNHTATLLPNGNVLVAGGSRDGGFGMDVSGAESEIAALYPSNSFTATLTLPTGWLNTTRINAQFVGTTSASAVNAGSLSNDVSTWGVWVTASPGITATTSWDVGGEGANKPISLRLRDVNGNAATVVTGTVNVDMTKPTSSMTALPPRSSTEIALAWSGTDTLSGVTSYDLQVQAGNSAWTDVLTNTTATRMTYHADAGVLASFRVRARDVAGNSEDWPLAADTATLPSVGSRRADITAPSDPSQPLMVTLSTPGGAIQLTFDDMRSSGVITAQISVAPLSNAPASFTLLGFNYEITTTGISFGKATLRIPYQDSDVSAAGIPEESLRLLHFDHGQWKDITTDVDTSANVVTGVTESFSPFVLGVQNMQQCTVSMNGGSVYTGQLGVHIFSNTSGAAEILVSNDAGFAGAQWQPYHSAMPWTITDPGNRIVTLSTYVRLRDAAGTPLCYGLNLSDDVIYDPLAPTVSVTTIQPAQQAQLTAQAGVAINVHLTASDQSNGSGVADMQLSTHADFSGAVWQPFSATASLVAQPGDTVYVRVRDGVGNTSGVAPTTLAGNYSVFLPMITR